MGEVNFVIKREIDKENVFCNPQICKMCGGDCCQRCGCAFSPNDFYVCRSHQFSEEEVFQYFKHFLKRGYASISHRKLGDRWTGAFVMEGISLQKLLEGEGALYIRMRNINSNIVDVWGISSGCCVGLMENGCRFSFEKRPRGGRELMPDLRSCIPVYSEYQAAIDWYPYQNILYKLYEEFK